MPYADKQSPYVKQKQRLYAKRYRDKNRDDPVYKEKERINNSKDYIKHRDNRVRKQREWRESDVARSLFLTAKNRAKFEGIPFDITIEDIIVPEFCPALGLELMMNRCKPGDNSPSLDRLNPSKGYVRGNVAVISFKANTIKSNANLDELRKVFLWLEACQEA